MSDEFITVTDRLKLVLGLPSDLALANELGLAQSAWSNRKTRRSLPTKAVDELISRYGLNPDYIYRGDGPTHAVTDEADRRALVTAKLAVVLARSETKKILVANGYGATDLAEITADLSRISTKFLRDLHLLVGVDLHELLCDDQPMTADEAALLAKFRSAGPDVQRIVLAALQAAGGGAAGVVVPTKKPRGASAIFEGAVGQVVKGGGVNTVYMGGGKSPKK